MVGGGRKGEEAEMRCGGAGVRKVKVKNIFQAIYVIY